MKTLVKVVGRIGFVDMTLFAYILASLNSIYQVVCCGYFNRYRGLDFKVHGEGVLMMWVALFVVSFLIGNMMSLEAYDEYEDSKEFSNATVFSVVSNSIAWIANSIYLSVLLLA